MEEGQLENKAKKPYFVAALLIIITLLMVVIVILLSNYLLQRQTDWLEDGKWLAEKYEDAVRFANHLQNGAELLLAGQELEGKMLLAQAVAHSRNFADLLAEAESRRDKKIRLIEAQEQRAAEMEKFHQKLGVDGEPEQWFSALDAAALEAIRDTGAQMSGALNRYRLPTVDAGYRIMASGDGWQELAVEAAAAWTNLVDRLP